MCHYIQQAFIRTQYRKAAKAQVAMLSTALDAYRLDVGRYPTTQEGLESLLENPGHSQWDGPYLPKESLPTDPWGRPFVYQCPGEYGDYDIYSLGPTGGGILK
jgi:general secretion pathway protein G